MINNEYKSSLSVDGLDEILHTQFRDRYYIKNGTLNGVNSKELILAAKRLVQVDEGKLVIEETMDQEAELLITHMNNTDNNRIIGDCNRIMRKNQKNQLNRVSVDRGYYKDVNTIKSHIIKKHGTLRKKSAIFLNRAMKLHLRVEMGLVKLVKPKKEVDNSFVSDNKGQINSLDNSTLIRAVTSLKDTVSRLESEIKELKDYTVQSTLNVSSKVVKKVKKVKNAVVMSGKSKDKRDKTERVLNNLKKRYEYRFTNKDYKEPLVEFYGHGDPRTLKSDLEMLEVKNLIRKVRGGAHSIDTYEFVENDQYYRYNSDLAKTRFFKDVKEKFFKDDAFTLVDLNDFIFEKYDLFDVKSQKKRLNWLLAEGLVRCHDVNPRLFFIE